MISTPIKISLESIEIAGEKLPVPVGLSDLLSETWVVAPKTNFRKSYERKVIKEEGGFVTVLTKK